MSVDFSSFIGRFDYAKETPRGSGQWLCRCPAHDDRKASLSIKNDAAGDRILVHCQAGCDTEDVLSAVGYTMRDIQPGDPARPLEPWEKNLTAEYRYKTSDGRYLYSKLRYEGEGIQGKDIRYARIENGHYTPGKGDVDPLLYNLSALRHAIKLGKTIYYVEGEKDVETLRKYGLTATTAGGVADWKSVFANEFLGAKEVVIIADRDAPGRDLAEQVSRDIRHVVVENKVITPSGIQRGDVTDYLTEEGGTIAGLNDIIKSADPIPATWLIKERVNVDLLAAEILERESIFVARDPGKKSDILYWYDHGVYRQTSETEAAARIRMWLPVGRGSPEIISKAVKMILYSAEAKNFDEIDADERFINLHNGLLDIHSGKLRKHDPSVISALQLNCDFDESARCPTWEGFVDDLCKDPEKDAVDIEMRNVLQEFTGFAFSAIYGKRIKKALLLNAFQGNTGRSVFLNVIGAIIGGSSVANVSFQEMGSSRWAGSRAHGKRALIIGDDGGNKIESSKTFKEMTGGDITKAEYKGKDAFDYEYRGVIIAACNTLPFFEDDRGNHIAERLLLLNFRNVIKKELRDPMLSEKLLTEKDGIFQWAWHGLQRFLDNGMRFSPCESADALMQDYRARHDNLYAFLLDRCDVTGNRADTIKKTELESAFNSFCLERDLKAISKKNITVRLASLGVPLVTRHGYSVYVGVRFKAFEGFENIDQIILPF